MKYTSLLSLWISLFMLFFLSSPGLPQKNEASFYADGKKFTLTRATICESIESFTPQNPAIVFSIAIGKIFCLTAFDPVIEETIIYHKWFHKDALSSKRKLTLKPPRWSTFSSIQLREGDKGPWRVEITDQQGNILQVLRFSITD